MRVLHVVKSADGAAWAAAQAAELVKLGVEVHVALPNLHGRSVVKWQDGGAILHVTPTDIVARRPWSIPATLRGLRELVSNVRPDLIHSHFVSSTILLRLALGAKSRIPRLFQIPGPLHLEDPFWRKLEISTAASCDSWISSSRCILGHYRSAGLAPQRLYLSYYGVRVETSFTKRSGALRKRYGIPDHVRIVGNANFIYPPKWYLGQRRGLKAHEDVIDALGLVVRQRPDVMGVLIGGSFSESQSYECHLRNRACAVAGNRIVMTGYTPVEEILQMWPDFDVAVHVPTSENCGGVLEPLLAGVPTIAGRVGGLPELVIDGITGKLVGVRNPEELARAVLDVIGDGERYRRLARTGRKLLLTMFDVRRTANEVLEIYRHVLGHGYPRPPEFDSEAELLASRNEHGERAAATTSSTPIETPQSPW